MTTPIDILKDLFCGCCSGWAQVFTMLPFQNIRLKVVSKPHQYNQGYIHTFKKTVAQQGLLSFYKGMLMPLIGVGAQVAVQFGTVQSLKKTFKLYFPQKDGSLNWKYSVLSGILCGFPSALVLTPLDHSRFRVALIKEKGIGSIKTAVNIYRNYGLRKLYLGLNSTIFRQSFLGVYFGTYDFCISFFKKDGKVSKIGSFMSGGLAGIATWTLLYPVDLVKTKIQSDSLDNPKYKNGVDCFRQMLKEGKGIKSFYLAFDIMILRAFFVNAFGFVAFQFAKKSLY